MNKLFEHWTWDRKQPEPFDQFDSSELRRKDSISQYNQGPKKVATVHSLLIRAVMTYMELEAEAATVSSKHTGALGSQGNDLTIAEYASISSDELHVVIYNRNEGKFKAGRYPDPINPTGKPESYSYAENGNSGTALFFALMPTAMGDREFNGAYQKLKILLQSGVYTKDDLLKSAALLCDNFYRRVENAANLGADGIPVKLTAGGVIPPIRPIEIKQGRFLATNVLLGDFEIIKSNYVSQGPAVVIPHKDFVGKYVLDESRVLSPEEEATVPDLPEWYIIPPEIKQICEHAKLTTGSTHAMRNFLMRGPASAGKTDGAKAIASALHLPYRFMTCYAGMEISDLVGQFLPDIPQKSKRKTTVFPSFTDIQMDPASAYYTLTNKYDDSVDGNVVLQEMLSIVSEQSRQETLAQRSGKSFKYVDTPLVDAMRYGYVLEIQEPTVITNPAVLVGLNGLLDQCKSITLSTGEIIERHPDTVIVMTTNVGYVGCRDMNQSTISRMHLVVDLEDPDEETLVKRVKTITGCKDISAIRTMAHIVKEIQSYCQEASIRDGCCSLRELIAWVQSYMICGNISEAAKYTVLASASSDGQCREEIQSRCLDTVLAA
ncbi:hypothetical protein CE91St62_39210 [Lachnospiraceae bacterium]|uniref:AAA family ATPase n=1 Tax=Extibacter sp. GGCC_0201 TaxID=2731209 RepID=UPI001AA1AD99|nr:AAA family ATPase [Extibacter sp. GGCC_0201]MBO1720715.1 AAA domain-containing protein [Extibacter sp. GGCC_0201]BDF35859.1 hypothetical protein CE91St61_39340 [Lachnospiraceae bacterium]BDF39860.1 hypothetical protein CE91St62_39210 [Lachnospiraceae bacterium]